jgi:hypothetical protein
VVSELPTKSITPRTGPCAARAICADASGSWPSTAASAQAGDYFVEYEDGYQSWSPKEIFERGYVRYQPTTLTQPG